MESTIANNLTLRQKQKAEALERMKSLKLAKNVIKSFKDEGVIYYSENQGGPFQGILYWLSNEPDYVKLVDEFEKKYNSTVYHAELSHLVFGDCLSLFYVSDTEEEWEMDREDLQDGYAFVYVVNLDDPDCSEFGTIGVRPINGGVVRTA